MLLVHATERIGKKIAYSSLFNERGGAAFSGYPCLLDKRTSSGVTVSGSVPRRKLPSISTHRDSAEKDSHANYYVQRQASN